MSRLVLCIIIEVGLSWNQLILITHQWYAYAPDPAASYQYAAAAAQLAYCLDMAGESPTVITCQLSFVSHLIASHTASIPKPMILSAFEFALLFYC